MSDTFQDFGEYILYLAVMNLTPRDSSSVRWPTARYIFNFGLNVQWHDGGAFRFRQT